MKQVILQIKKLVYILLAGSKSNEDTELLPLPQPIPKNICGVCSGCWDCLTLCPMTVISAM